LRLFLNKIVKHQRKWYGRWHTWTGIIAGSILIVVSLTGALLVFEDELDVYLNADVFSFKEKKEQILPIDKVYDIVDGKYPNTHFFNISYKPELNKAYILYYLKNGQQVQVIADPYTGEVMGSRIYEHTFLGIIHELHRNLLIPYLGRYIVVLATIFMIVLMITGLRLWIPQQIKNLKSRIWVNFKNKPKRVNYDLHNALGFYFSPFITLISLTGIAITFSSLIVLGLFLADFQKPQSIGNLLNQNSSYIEGKSTLKIDSIIRISKHRMPDAKVMAVFIPKDSIEPFKVNFKKKGIAETGDHSFALYDQYTGEKIINTEKDFANIGKLAINWIGPLHYGTFGGLTTRIIALVSALIVPVLFISGFIIWWDRVKRKFKKNKK